MINTIRQRESASKTAADSFVACFVTARGVCRKSCKTPRRPHACDRTEKQRLTSRQEHSAQPVAQRAHVTKVTSSSSAADTFSHFDICTRFLWASSTDFGLLISRVARPARASFSPLLQSKTEKVSSCL